MAGAVRRRHTSAMPAPIHEYAAALHEHLTRFPPTEGFRLVDVRAEADQAADDTTDTKGDQVAVVFRWRRNPHTFVLRFDREFAGVFGPEDVVTRTPHDDVVREVWCENVGFWLMEELDTGLLARARRRRAGPEIVLTAPVPQTHDAPQVWVDEVPQFAPEVHLPWRIHAPLAARSVLARIRGRRAPMAWATWGSLDAEPGDGLRDGEWLGEAGMDPARVRAIRDDGRLLVWLQALTDALEDQAVGQCAVVTTVDPQIARIEVLETTNRAPEGLRDRLVLAGVHVAADEGARTVLVPDGRGGDEAVDTALC